MTQEEFISGILRCKGQARAIEQVAMHSEACLSLRLKLKAFSFRSAFGQNSMGVIIRYESAILSFYDLVFGRLREGMIPLNRSKELRILDRKISKLARFLSPLASLAAFNVP